MHGLGLQFMEIGCSFQSICKDSHNTCSFHDPEMLFHSLSGGEMHGVIDEMDRRSKTEASAISSAIDRGETETVGSGRDSCLGWGEARAAGYSYIESKINKK